MHRLRAQGGSPRPAVAARSNAAAVGLCCLGAGCAARLNFAGWQPSVADFVFIMIMLFFGRFIHRC